MTIVDNSSLCHSQPLIRYFYSVKLPKAHCLTMLSKQCYTWSDLRFNTSYQSNTQKFRKPKHLKCLLEVFLQGIEDYTESKECCSPPLNPNSSKHKRKVMSFQDWFAFVFLHKFDHQRQTWPSFVIQMSFFMLCTTLPHTHTVHNILSLLSAWDGWIVRASLRRVGLSSRSAVL